MHQPDLTSATIECRVCLRMIRMHKAVSLFSSMNTKDGNNIVKTVVDVMREFAEVKVALHKDRSNHICSNCLRALENGINLRQQIRANEQAVIAMHDLQVPKTLLDEHEYEFEYLDEFKDEIASGASLSSKPTNQQMAYESSSSGSLTKGDAEVRVKQLSIQLSEEETECLQDGSPEQGKFAFEMPSSQLIAQRFSFDEFDYLEICGERCCGCAYIAPSRDELMVHAKEKHSQNYYADSSYTCPTCYQKFPTEDSLTKHTQYYSYSDVFLCTVCYEAFNFRSHLLLHLKQKHRHRHEPSDDEEEPKVPNKESFRRSSRHPLALPDESIIKNIHEFPEYRQYSLRGECCCACGLYVESVEAHAAEEHLNVEVMLKSEDALSCIICSRKFSSQRQLVLHEQERRKLNHFYECRLCSKLFTKKYLLLRHLQREKNYSNGLVCTEGKNGTMKATGSKQQRTPLPGVYELDCFCCCFKRCKEEYATEAELLEHACEAHSGRRKENEMKLTNPLSEVSAEKLCQICMRLFNSVEKLKNHRSYKLHIEKQSCHICERTFMRAAGLREHQEREHLDLPPRFGCEICGKKFITRSTLNHHRRVHGPFRSCPCVADGCDSVFRDEFLMRRHYRSVHAENKPYGCRYCQKVFRTKESLDIHERCHTGEKPFACRHEGCKQRFSHGSDRMRHERSVHTGERPHRCQVCNTSFVRKRELRIHTERLHKKVSANHQ